MGGCCGEPKYAPGSAAQNRHTSQYQPHLVQQQPGPVQPLSATYAPSYGGSSNAPFVVPAAPSWTSATHTLPSASTPSPVPFGHFQQSSPSMVALPAPAVINGSPPPAMLQRGPSLQSPVAPAQDEGKLVVAIDFGV